MESELSGLWWLVVIVSGAVGMGLLVYGIKQKEPVSLVFGLAVSAVPMLTSSGALAALLLVSAGALFFVVRKLA